MPMLTPKCRHHNLPSRIFPFWLLWMGFAGSCSIGWLPIWFWSTMVIPYSIHCHISYVKILFISPKQLQHVFVFAEKWAHVASTSNSAFSCINAHAKWSVGCSLITLGCQLSHAILRFRLSKRFRFFVFYLEQLRNSGDQSISAIGVTIALFKISKPLTN